MKRLASVPVGVARHRVSLIKERQILKLIAIPLCLFTLAAGCGYQLTGRGDAFPRDVRTVFVDPIVNRSKEIGVEREMTTLLKSELTRLGRASQPEAVFFLTIPLLTAFPNALLTSRRPLEICSASFFSIACRAFLI